MQVESLKCRLRKDYLEKRLNLSNEEIKKNSFKVCNSLERLVEKFSKIEKIMGYQAIKNEIDVTQFIRFCIKNKKLVYFPKFSYEKDAYIFVRVCNVERDFKIGKYGILEPISCKPALNQEEILDRKTMWLVPGIVFDHNGNRIGFGKGYYDSILRNSKGPKIGIAHQKQYYNDIIPTKPYDIPMNIIVTENNMREMGNEK